MENFEASLSCNKDALIETVAEKVEVLQDLAKYFCKSMKGAVEKLKLLQSGKPVGCILDAVIRWNRGVVCYIQTVPGLTCVCCWYSIDITSWFVMNELFERTGEKERIPRNSFFKK